MAPSPDQTARHKRQLQQEIAALEHELRRLRDAIERSPTHDLEKRAQQLRDNIALCERDLRRHIERVRDAEADR